MWLVLEDEEWNRDASGKIETKYSIRKTIATYISTNLLVLRDYDSILIVYDRFLKMLYFIVIAEKFWQKGWQDCLETIYESYMSCLRVWF